MSVYALDPQKISSSITCNNVLTGLLLREPFKYVHKQYVLLFKQIIDRNMSMIVALTYIYCMYFITTGSRCTSWQSLRIKKCWWLFISHVSTWNINVVIKMLININNKQYIFTVFRLLTDFVCLYNYEFWLSLYKIVRSSVILLLPLFVLHVCVVVLSTSLSEKKDKINNLQITVHTSVLVWLLMVIF